MSSMSVLCYPYGNGITCVCDEARIYKCFPHLKSDLKSQTGSQGGDGQLGQVHTANLNDGLDRSTEIVLASTFLILVILIFLAFLVHRCEKTFSRSRSRVQDDLSEHSCPKSEGLSQYRNRILSNSVSIQTEPQLWALRPSHVTGELTMTNPCKSLSSCQLGEAATSYYGIISTEVKTTSSRSYDHLLGSLPSRSGSGGAQHSEMEEMSDTDNPGLVL